MLEMCGKDTRDNKKIDLKTKNSEPILQTQREMFPSLTERDLLNQVEKTMPYENNMTI